MRKYNTPHRHRVIKTRLTEQTEDEKQRGKLCGQEIEIYYSFVGKAELPE